MKYFRARPKIIEGGMIVDGLPHRLKMTDANIVDKLTEHNSWLTNDVLKWCDENYGEIQFDWAFGLRGGTLTLYFMSKEDAMAFKLRWL